MTEYIVVENSAEEVYVMTGTVEDINLRLAVPPKVVQACREYPATAEFRFYTKTEFEDRVIDWSIYNRDVCESCGACRKRPQECIGCGWKKTEEKRRLEEGKWVDANEAQSQSAMSSPNRRKVQKKWSLHFAPVIYISASE